MTHVGEIVRMIRGRLPFVGGVPASDSPLPYMARRPSVNPILPVGDMAEAIGFYRGLGYDVVSYDEQYAWVRHCGWEIVHLRLVEGLDPLANETTAFVHVDDADRWRSGFTTPPKATAAATELGEMGAVRDEPWGMREFSVTDPSGNVLRYGSPT